MDIIPSKKEQAFFNMAAQMSRLANHPKHKLGCVVVDKHRVISSGYNDYYKYHPLQVKIDTKRFGCNCKGCVHAETSALIPLIKQGYDLSRASIYVYREHKDGTLAASRPCSGCQSLINACGLKTIYYTTEKGYCKEKT